MNFRELGEGTLITKGTLSGVVARLQSRGLVERFPHPQDGQSEMLRLTAAGNDLFEQVFPAHVTHCQQAFQDWSGGDFDDLDIRLTRLRDALSNPALTRAGTVPPHQD